MTDPLSPGSVQRTSAPPEPDLPGPFAVGRYAGELREFLRARARVRVIGELVNFKQRGANAYFELRDSDGALPCAIWSNELERMGIPEGALKDGVEVVVSGGPDYYAGSGQSSPSFSFRATHLKLAGEGDLLARLAALRRTLAAEGLFEPQRLLPRPVLPKGIGIVTGGGSAAQGDLRAGFARRSWRGTVVWAHPPMQDRRAAGAFTRAVQDLAALAEVEVVIVARGGGSLADLWAFCDETLCRTVALLGVPVISAIGHETDNVLLDDVAALSCSTPTHAAEQAVQVDIAQAIARVADAADLLRVRGAGAIKRRAESLRTAARVPATHLRRERAGLDQRLREIRAAAQRGIDEREGHAARMALVLARKSGATRRTQVPAEVRQLTRIATALTRERDAAQRNRARQLLALTTALRAHEPDRVLERGFALAEDNQGEPVTSAKQAREAGDVRLRFADAAVDAKIGETDDRTED